MSTEIEAALTPREHAQKLFMQGVPKAEIAQVLGISLEELKQWARGWASVDVDTLMPVERVYYAFAQSAVPLVENLMAACERLSRQLHEKPHKEMTQAAAVIAKMAGTALDVVKVCGQKTERVLDPTVAATQVNMHFPGVRLPDAGALMSATPMHDEETVFDGEPVKGYLDEFQEKARQRLEQIAGVAEDVVAELDLEVPRSGLDKLRAGEDIGAGDTAD